MPGPTSAGEIILSPEMDRRGCVRYACALQGDCQPITPLEAGNRWPAQLLDISSAGVGLMLSRRFEPGTLLTLDLAGTERETTCFPVARVCQVRREGAYWLMGCRWAHELAADELRRLLRPAVMHAGLFRKVHKTLRQLDGVMPRRKTRSLRATFIVPELEPTAPPPAPSREPLLTRWLARALPLWQAWRLRTT